MLLFTFGMQTDLSAQLRIFNNSSCTISVWAGASDNTSCSPCGVSAPNQLAPGGFVILPYDPSCGPDELWLAIRWIVAAFTPFPGAQQVGQSFNPGVTCGTDITPLCNGVGQTATWNFLGPNNGFGPATVVIQ